VAIMVGDYLFSKASLAVAELGVDFVKLQARTFSRLVQGQIAETRGPSQGQDPLAHYLKVVADKTGSLIAASAVFGAMVSHASAENVAAFPTPGANNHGMFGVLDSDGSLRWVDFTVGNAVLAACNIVPSSSYDTVEIDLHSLVLDATNPPTVATKGTTPTIRGLLFDAANELAVVQCVVPSNWSADADLVLELDCVLNQGETAGDDIDWDADWVAVTQNVDAVSKASTAATAVDHDIGTAIADGTLHRVPIVIDFDDVSNPVAAGDLLAIQVHRSDLALVGGVIVVAARLKFTQKPRHERA